MTNFNTYNHIGKKSVLSSVEDNIKAFLDNGFLNIGGFINAVIPANGTNPVTNLKPVDYPPYKKNTVWQSERKDWIYESNIDYSNQPISISGIYVNNNYVLNLNELTQLEPLSSSAYSYNINYPLGQIIFTNPQSSSTNVKLNYSYRYIQVYKSNENIWWKELQNSTYNPQKTRIPDGDLQIFADHRVQLPAIIVEMIPRMYQTPYQLGSVQNIITQDVLLHIFTNTPQQRSQIVDILIAQKDKDSFFYDIDKVVKNNKYFLSKDGSKNVLGLSYKQILQNTAYLTNAFYIENAIVSEYNQFSSNLYNSVVRWTLKIYP
jgi:hypothetical protein